MFAETVVGPKEATDVETVFALSSVLVLPFWLLMIALPRWRWTRRLVASPLIVVPPVLLYVLLLRALAPARQAGPARPAEEGHPEGPPAGLGTPQAS
jgi:hypothetical protein